MAAVKSTSFIVVKTIPYQEILLDDPKMLNSTSYLLMHSTGISNWKDTQLKFLGCSERVVEFLGFNHTDDIVGKTDVDLLWGQNGYADFFKQEDEKVLSGYVLYILGRYQFFGEEKIVLVKKFPLLLNQEIIGVVCHLIEFHQPFFLNIISYLDKIHVKIDSDLSDNIKRNLLCHFNQLLSSREEECLYYTVQGFTAKQVANLLNISYRTVEEYVASVKCKLHCKTKSELIGKAMELGYQYKKGF